MIEVLLAAGSDPDTKNAAGQSPRGLAKLIANHDVARFFRAKGVGER